MDSRKLTGLTAFLLSVLMMISICTVGVTASAATDDGDSVASQGVNVTVKSNIFPEFTKSFDADTDTLTVSYYIQCEKDMLNSQWALTYDPTVLRFNPSKNILDDDNGVRFMPQATDCVSNYEVPNHPEMILGNCSRLSLYKLSTKEGGRVPFVTATFDVIGSGDTTVNLNLEIMQIAKVDSKTHLVDAATEEDVVEYDKIFDTSVPIVRESYVYAGKYSDDPYPVEEPTTAPATTEPTTAEPTTAPATTEPATEPTQPVVGETTLNFVVPKTVSSPKCWDDGIYLAYSNQYAINTFTKIQLTKTADFLTPDLKTDKLTAGTYALYTVTLSKEQAEAVSKAIYVVLVNKSNTYKTYVSSKYNLLKAPTGTYSADYNTAKTSLANLNDYTFIMNGEVKTGTSIDGYGTYTGYWTKCTTVYAVTPASTKWKNCWNQGVYIGYSNDYKIDSFNKIKMTRTSTYVDVDSKTSQLVSGTYPVYTVTLTEDQVAAIDASAYVIFENASGTYRTYINGKYSVMKAPAGNEYSSEYTKTKAKLADRAKNTFVICDGISTGSSIEGYGTFTGYWSTSEVKIVESAATLYCVFPAPVKGKTAMNNGVYLAYGSSNSPADLTKIEMKKTDDKYTPSLKTNALVGGAYSVYSVTLNSDQIEAIDNAKNVVFCNSNGSFRTLLSPGYNVLNAKSGSYSATYNKGTFTTADHNGETFVVCDSKVTGSSTDGYGMFLGYWNLGEK